jgi:hypothetical protein
MVRSKSEVIIANMLFERDIRFKYETVLTAPDGTFYLPDFTIIWSGEHLYWEHWGRMDDEKYRNHRTEKVKWYKKNFPDRLIETFESSTLSTDADVLIKKHFPMGYSISKEKDDEKQVYDFVRLLSDLNTALGTSWQECDVPKLPASPGWKAARKVLEEWAAKSKTTWKQWSKEARQILERWWKERKRLG